MKMVIAIIKPFKLDEVREALSDIGVQGIMVDRDEEGYLLQIFTRPVEDRPTLR